IRLRAHRAGRRETRETPRARCSGLSRPITGADRKARGGVRGPRTRQAPGGAVRISVDGRMVMDRVTALYAVLPGEVVFGANPLGMSTSGSLFEGDLIVVRTHQAAEDLFPGNR